MRGRFIDPRDESSGIASIRRDRDDLDAMGLAQMRGERIEIFRVAGNEQKRLATARQRFRQSTPDPRGCSDDNCRHRPSLSDSSERNSRLGSKARSAARKRSASEPAGMLSASDMPFPV